MGVKMYLHHSLTDPTRPAPFVFREGEIFTSVDPASHLKIPPISTCWCIPFTLIAAYRLPVNHGQRRRSHLRGSSLYWMSACVRVAGAPRTIGRRGLRIFRVLVNPPHQ